MSSRQTEFVFPVELNERVRSRRPGRNATSQPNRLPIAEEAFDTAPRMGIGISGRREGTLEAVATVLMTVVFGLTWAAIELERVSVTEGSGYDVNDPRPVALWDLATTTTNPRRDESSQSRDQDRGQGRGKWTRTSPAHLVETKHATTSSHPNFDRTRAPADSGEIGRSSKP